MVFKLGFHLRKWLSSISDRYIIYILIRRQLLRTPIVDTSESVLRFEPKAPNFAFFLGVLIWQFVRTGSSSDEYKLLPLHMNPPSEHAIG